MTGFTITGARQLLDAEFFSVEELSVRATHAGPDSDDFARTVVRHCGAVVVVPMIDDDTVVCVRQYRAGVDRFLLEVVAGRRDVNGEPTEVTAQRELAEEIGMRAEHLTQLAAFYNSPGFTDEHTTLYLAQGLTELASASPEGEEELAMTVVHVPLADMHELIRNGELIDAKSIIGLSLAQAFLKGETPGMQ